MKRFKLAMITALVAAMGALAANADTIGYVNYKTVD